MAEEDLQPLSFAVQRDRRMKRDPHDARISTLTDLLISAHNALLPLAQWEKPCEPTAADCIRAGEVLQDIRAAVPMVPMLPE